MTNLGESYEELAQCLNIWSPSLTIQLDKQKSNQDSISKSNSSHGCDRDQTSPLVTNLMELGIRTAGTQNHETAKQLNEFIYPHWKDAGAYAKSIKSVLDSRDNLEVSF